MARRLSGLLMILSKYVNTFGQGLIRNNVLHDRSGFEESDEHKRLLYRVRDYQRIAKT